MSILAMIVLGALAGWIASMIMGTNSQQNIIGDVLLGVVGAILGGFLVNLFGYTAPDGLNVYSILVSVLGAVALIYIGRFLSSLR